MQRKIYPVWSVRLLSVASIFVNIACSCIIDNSRVPLTLSTPCQVIARSMDVMSQVDWSPDGKRVVFITQSTLDKQEKQISIVNADGTGYKTLTNYKSDKSVYKGQVIDLLIFTPYKPIWLSDNLRIIFRLVETRSAEPGISYKDQYIVINTASLISDVVLTSGYSMFTIGAATDFDLRSIFSISPDDQILAFSKFGKLKFVSLNNQSLNNVVLLPFTYEGNASSFSWSPDSHYVLITDGELQLVDVRASFKVTHLPLPAVSKGVWLHDSSKFAYLNNGIYIANFSGDNAKQIISRESKTYVNENNNIGWLDNGTKIGFVSQRNQDTELYSVGVQDQLEQQITYNNTTDEPLNPVWSQDGEHVLFSFSGTLQVANANISCDIVNI